MIQLHQKSDFLEKSDFLNCLKTIEGLCQCGRQGSILPTLPRYAVGWATAHDSTGVYC
ncbi:hypothetical protein QUF75_18495 [Desulfococcaceae bacterium HSG7]|nr:hypothetical protein [Desulfococcaceae bacterium HSG7]